MGQEQNIASANKLLDRDTDQEYLQEWSAFLKIEKREEETHSENSVVIFRLFNEWLALSTQVFLQVAEKRQVHTIPHRSGKVLRGIVNLRGQLCLCVALHNLLEIDLDEQKDTLSSFHRFVAIQKKDNKWVFPVNEVYGIFRCELSLLRNVPVTVTKSTANYLKGVISWEDKSVGYIDEDLLFASLLRILL